MGIHRHLFTISLLGFLLSSCLHRVWQDSSSTLDTDASASYRDFLATRPESEINEGVCVATAEALMDHLNARFPEATSPARVVLMMLPPEPKALMPQSLHPDKNVSRGNPCQGWIWHAFVMFNGEIFDPNYTHSPKGVKTYFEEMWATEPHLSQAWIFVGDHAQVLRVRQALSTRGLTSTAQFFERVSQLAPLNVERLIKQSTPD
jgi:hypothetical protein